MSKDLVWKSENMISKKKSYMQLLVWFTYIFYLFTIFAFGDRSETYVISNITFIALIGLIVLRLGSKMLHIRRSFLSFLPFVIFSFLSLLWSYDYDATFEASLTLLKLFILLVFLAKYIYETGEISEYINGIAIASFLVVIYLIAFYRIDVIFALMSNGQRVGDDVVNSNKLAMFLSLGAVISLMRCFETKQKILIILYVILFGVIALTGSKKGIIDIILGSLITISLSQGKSDKNRYIKWILRTLIVLIGIYFLWEQPIFATIRYRMEIMIGTFLRTNAQNQTDYSTLQRQELIRVGISQFVKTPLLGVGINASGFLGKIAVNFSTYLHNNYIELLATGGIVGTLLYYYPVISVFVSSIKKRNNSNDIKLCMLFLLIQFINDTGAVQYALKFTYVIFAICLACVASCKNGDSMIETGDGSND